MTTPGPGRLVILSGPSCVGKSPLARCLGRFHPELHRRLHKLVLFNSRSPRPGEIDGVDYHFRTRRQVEAMHGQDRFSVLEVRGDLQALEIPALTGMLERGDAFFEGNPFVGRLLQAHPALAQVRRLSVFMAPLSRDEILFFKDPGRNVALPELVTDVMRRKLLRRTRQHKGELSLPDLENIEHRAGSAFRELQEAVHFDWVIPNHEGEDSDHWDAFYYPLGDARKALQTFVDLLEGRRPTHAEKWNAELMA